MTDDESLIILAVDEAQGTIFVQQKFGARNIFVLQYPTNPDGFLERVTEVEVATAVQGGRFTDFRDDIGGPGERVVCGKNGVRTAGIEFASKHALACRRRCRDSRAA